MCCNTYDDLAALSHPHVAFRQLRFFALNMLEFGVSRANVAALLDKYARFLNIGDKEADELIASIDDFDIAAPPR